MYFKEKRKTKRIKNVKYTGIRPAAAPEAIPPAPAAKIPYTITVLSVKEQKADKKKSGLFKRIRPAPAAPAPEAIPSR